MKKLVIFLFIILFYFIPQSVLAETHCYCALPSNLTDANPVPCPVAFCQNNRTDYECNCNTKAYTSEPCSSTCELDDANPTPAGGANTPICFCGDTTSSVIAPSRIDCSSNCSTSQDKIECDCNYSYGDEPCQTGCLLENSDGSADADAGTGAGADGTESGGTSGVSLGGGTTAGPQGPRQLPDFLGTSEPGVVIGRIIKYIMGFVGVIALITFMYGGGLWLISAGRIPYVEKGKNTMVSSAIGLAIVFAAYIMIDFVFKLFGK